MEEKIAEFIGIMLGDGNFGVYGPKNRKKSQYRIRVSLDSRNISYLDHVKSVFREVLGIEPKIYFKSKENAVDVQYCSKEIFLFVKKEIGLLESPKWNSMKIPDNYFKKELFPFILRGLFDTDGCLSIFNNNGTKYPRIEIKICPSPAQDQFKQILETLDINYRIQILDKNEIRLRISGKKELMKWFETIGSSNKIHIDKAHKMLNSEGRI